MVRGFRLIFATSLLLMLLGICNGSKIGICYGRNADDLPTPDKAVELIKNQNINSVRIYDSNIQVLKAFANTGIDLMIGIPNSDLLPFSQFQSNADTWLKNNILPYYPATKITYITVGAEVTEAPNNVSAMVVPAMTNVYTALRKAGLHRKIKVSTTHSLGVLSRSYPPSAGAFNSKHAGFLKPLLEFLAEKQSPFLVNTYPYYAYQDSSNNVSLDYALFESSSEIIDPNTGLLYTNMFDAQIDSIYFALTGLNFKTIKITVTETGWPSKGSPKETAATPENAQTYNTNLIRHVINNTGTPAKPGEAVDVYVFSLFNENRKPGLESERNWGLYYPDQTSVYNVDFTGRGSVDVNTGGNFTSGNGNGNGNGNHDYGEIERNGNKKRKVKNPEKKAWGFVANQLAQLREMEARFEQREEERERERNRKELFRRKQYEERRKQRNQEWEAMEKEREERRRRRDEEVTREREWEERGIRRRSEWNRRIDEMLSQHRVEMAQIHGRILEEQQNVTSQLLGIVSQWNGSDNTSASNHYLSQMMQNLQHVGGMVDGDDARVEGHNQDDQFIVDG